MNILTKVFKWLHRLYLDFAQNCDAMDNRLNAVTNLRHQSGHEQRVHDDQVNHWRRFGVELQVAPDEIGAAQQDDQRNATRAGRPEKFRLGQGQILGGQCGAEAFLKRVVLLDKFPCRCIEVTKVFLDYRQLFAEKRQ